MSTSKKANKTESEDPDLIELQEEGNLRDYVGHVVIISNVTIDHASTFDIVRMQITLEDGTILQVRSASKVIERQLQEIAGTQKKVKACVSEQKSKYNTPMLILKTPDACKKIGQE